MGGSSTFGSTAQRYALSVHKGGEGGGPGYFVPDIDELREAQQAFEAVRQRIADGQRGWHDDRPRRNAEAREIGWKFAGEPIFAALGGKLFQGVLGRLARLRATTAPASSADAAVGSQALLAAPKMVKHHIFNVFRGNSPRSQVYRNFFKKHGIELDKHTVEVSEAVHRQLHTAGNNWTTRWKAWIDANPNATTREVYQQAGRMMDDYGIQRLPIGPY